jgi:hypothetical protein
MGARTTREPERHGYREPGTVIVTLAVDTGFKFMSVSPFDNL